MRVLITGGTGFIGSYLVPALLESGYDVRLLVRNEEKAKRLFGNRCEYHIGDIINKDSLHGCCENVDIVYHLAAKSGNDLPSKEHFSSFREMNVTGTQNILDECTNIKRFIYVSSTAVMGIVKEKPINELSKCHPYLPYQVSKYEAENLIRERCKDGFPGVIVRPTKVYGIGEKDYSYLTLAKLCKRGIFFKIGRRMNYTSNVYVTDFVSALVNLSSKGILGEVYIVTSEKSLGFNECGKIIATKMGKKVMTITIPEKIMVFLAYIEENLFLLFHKKPIVTKRNIEMTITDRIYDISKAKKDLDYYPLVSMEEGINRVVQWYIDEGII